MESRKDFIQHYLNPFHTYYASLLRRRVKSVPLTSQRKNLSRKK